MIKIYKYEDLGHADHGWLNARHHFSFASYHDPKRMGFGVLRVINDDIIQAKKGFDTHPHQDMEIITYVRKGAITHRDSQGNEGKTLSGDVQVMSAGTGVFHSEYNLENEDTNIYQIWIKPKIKGVNPSWDSCEFPKESTSDKLKLLVSGDSNAPLFINQDAYIYAGKLDKNQTVSHNLKYQAYILVSEGEIEIDGQIISKGDGAEITNLRKIDIESIKNSEVLVIDVPEV